MRDTDLSLADIAATTCYSDVAAFSRAFSAHGSAPRLGRGGTISVSKGVARKIQVPRARTSPYGINKNSVAIKTAPPPPDHRVRRSTIGNTRAIATMSSGKTI